MTVTVSSKGRITLPVEVRRCLGIRAGTQLEFIIRGDDRLEVFKVGGSVQNPKGALAKPPRRLWLEEFDEAIAAGARRSAR